MIRSFRHAGLKRLFDRGDRSRIRPDLLNKVTRVLSALDAADSPRALDLPGYNLHPLKGKWKGRWSVWITGNWRIVFRFEEGDAHDIDLIDYH